jgi:hypothetical protein
MNRLIVLLLVVTSVQSSGQKGASSAPVFQMTVQLYAETKVSNDPYVEVYDVFLGLPDGTRAVGHCLTMSVSGVSCRIEPFSPEKRIAQNCLQQPNEQYQSSCFTNEKYYANRYGNDITLYGARGAVKYHITGSWTEFKLGIKPSNAAAWTAVCQDGTLSYSQNRSGTCADHGGVKAWR